MHRYCMPRTKFAPTSIYPVHITARCPNREPFPIPLPDVWSIMEDFLYLIHHQYEVGIHSFVLMPNHFHLIATSKVVDFGIIMRDLMRSSSLALNDSANMINQQWGSRHFRSEMQSSMHFINTYKYIYQNPVRANLCSRCEDWRFSTLNGLMGRSRLIIPMELDTVLFNDDFNWKEIEWLNSPIAKPNLTAIRAGLSKTVFNLPKDGPKRSPHALNLTRA